jgi:hypothetical protein
MTCPVGLDASLTGENGTSRRNTEGNPYESVFPLRCPAQFTTGGVLFNRNPPPPPLDNHRTSELPHPT